ncbi:MAG TPA: DUF6160 family protein [Smithella sp.]|nr:DUF6160 family protein [Smithella sp.]
MNKFLPGHNFIRIITFISILLLFFVVSIYDSPVYALQAMDDDSLSQIEAQEGITVGLNLTVSSVVTAFSFGNDLSSALAQSVNVGTLTVGNGAGEGFGINTNLTIDVGTNTTDNRTWLYLSGLVLPSTDSGICVSANDISITVNSSTWTLGNLDITGLYMGRTLTTITPNYIAGDAPWISLSGSRSSGGGIVFYAGLGLYINNVTFAYPTDSMNISGIYIYGASPNVASGTPASWPALTGNMQIGGVFNTYDVNGNVTGTYNAGPAAFDVGSNSSSTTGTEVSFNLPMALSIRVKDFQMDSTHDFGPMALDNVIIYRNVVTYRNL